MDFYHIGAMNVFSQLGQLIEEDEQNQVKLTDLPSDIMQQIGSYLLEDKNKTIHKIFKDKQDDDLQVILFGEVKDLTYINIYDSSNEIDYTMNDTLKNYVNYILKIKGVANTCHKMRVRFHVHTYKNPNVQEARVIIKFLNNKDKEIAAIKQVYHVGGLMGVGSGYNYYLSYRLNDEWKKQGIKKNDIIKEFNIIETDVINKYFP
jgi:hypothetical protein